MRTIKFVGLWLLFAGLLGGIGYLIGGVLAATGLIAAGHAWGNPVGVFWDVVLVRHRVSAGLGPILGDLPSFGLIFGIALAGLMAARRVDGRTMASWMRPDGPPRWRNLWTAWALGLAAFALLTAFEGLLSPDGFNPETGWLGSGWGKAALAAVAWAATGLVWAGAEEIIFRGLIMRRLQPAIGLVSAALVSSLLFWLIHRDLTLAGAVAYLSMGLGLCWTAIRTGGLEAAIGVHAAYNLVADLAGDQAPDDASGALQAMLFGLVALAAMVAIAELIRRRQLPHRSTGTAAPAPSGPAGRRANPP